MIGRALVLLQLLLRASFARAETLASVASVIDGDTIVIHGQRI
jgi:endonuclease YncB( thermonuclease family)